jgi:hypothetical protein
MDKVWVCIELTEERKFYTQLPSSYFADGKLNFGCISQDTSGFLKVDEEMYTLSVVPDPSAFQGAKVALIKHSKHPPDKLQKPYFINLSRIAMITQMVEDNEIIAAIRQSTSGIQAAVSKLIV